MLDESVLLTHEELGALSSFLEPPAQFAFAGPPISPDAADRGISALVARGLVEIEDETLVPVGLISLMLEVTERATELVTLTAERQAGGVPVVERQSWLADDDLALEQHDVAEGFSILTLRVRDVALAEVAALIDATADTRGVPSDELRVSVPQLQAATGLVASGTTLTVDTPGLLRGVLEAAAQAPVLRTLECRRRDAGSGPRAYVFEWMDSPHAGAWLMTAEAGERVIRALDCEALRSELALVLACPGTT